MKTFSTVEDYLEVLAGKRDIVTGTAALSGWMGYEFKPIVNLARYDVNFLDSVTNQTLTGQALTDKQAELSMRIIAKYQRQLTNKSLDIEPILLAPRYRVAVRILDRSKTAKIEDNQIVLRFPYDQKFIEYMRTVAKTRQGKVVFDRVAKVWHVGLTEFNVNWVVEFCKLNEFVIGDELSAAMQQILDCEATEYSIKLVLDNGALTIANAAPELLTYVQNTIGFESAHLTQLVDAAPVLGYTIDDDIRYAIEQEYGGRTAVFMFNRTYDLRDNQDKMPASIMKYADLVQRYPVVVYDPRADFDLWRELVPAEATLDMTNKRDAEAKIEPHHKLVLANRSVKHMDTLPLLVSHVGMIVGSDKKIMTDRAEKIIYLNGKLG